jgi:hypothetical protein
MRELAAYWTPGIMSATPSGSRNPLVFVPPPPPMVRTGRGVQLADGDVMGHVAALGFEEGRVRRDSHGFSQGAELQTNINTHDLRRGEIQAGASVVLESSDLHRELVGTHGKLRHGIVSGGSGGCLVSKSVGRISNRRWQRSQ